MKKTEQAYIIGFRDGIVNALLTQPENPHASSKEKQAHEKSREKAFEEREKLFSKIENLGKLKFEL